MSQAATQAPICAAVAIIGAGPAGLMAAQVLSAAGHQVEVFDAMPSVGRKFLLAGKGGMNITHSEHLDAFTKRYEEAAPVVGTWLRDFGADEVRQWVHSLGIETFVGSSGRVFPKEMKAAPLLRAWLHRLRDQEVHFHARTRWLGWEEGSGALLLQGPEGSYTRQFDAVLLALGGASWPRLGSDGAWVPLLAARGVDLSPLRSANCGFDIGWSQHFSTSFAGQPLHTVAITYDSGAGRVRHVGQCMITESGIEGSLIYAISSALRRQIERNGVAEIELDLMPDWPPEKVLHEVSRPRGTRSWSSHLQSRLGLKGVKVGLLREVLGNDVWQDAGQIAHIAKTVKALHLRLQATRPLPEVISTAGGVRLDELDQQLMLKALPGVFCAGEMLDWEAPTGGYLLTACLASGFRAGHGMCKWLA